MEGENILPVFEKPTTEYEFFVRNLSSGIPCWYFIDPTYLKYILGSNAVLIIAVVEKETKNLIYYSVF
jgi:hypothetical protein